MTTEDRKATVDKAYNIDGDLTDPHLPDSPIAPGVTLQEMTVLHLYRRPILEPDKPKVLIGFYCHPNPEAIDQKQRELEQAPENWHIDRVRYIRSDLAIKVKT